jgi:pimeloyl-ACP methyl ester carboxylesterase
MSTSFIEERRATYAGFGTRELAVEGAGCTVVLVHGFAHSADAWVPVLKMLHDSGQETVAVDLPGFGSADPPRTGELVPQMDAFLAELICHYGAHQHAVVVGNSLGAALAARAARDTALPVGAVMPLDIAGILWTSLVSRGLGPLGVCARQLSGLRLPTGAQRAMTRRAIGMALYGHPSAVDSDVVAAVADGIPDFRAASRLVRLGAMFKAELDRSRHHGGIGVPMTVVHGRRDRLVPVSASRVLYEANPGSRLVVLERAGHCPQLDAPRAVAHYARELARIATATKEIS